MKSLGIPVKNRADMGEFLKSHNIGSLQQAVDDIQAAYGKRRKKRTIFNSDLKDVDIEAIQEYIESLPNNTDISKGLYLYNKYTKRIYKFNTSLSQYKDNRLEGRDGFEILDVLETNELNEEQINEIENGFKENKTGFDSWLKRTGYEKRTRNGRNELVKNGETIDNHDGLDSHTLSGASRRGQSDRDSQGNQGENSIKDSIPFFTTPQGEIYGFIDLEGNIYLDETVISPEHPIHEYTHLWDRVVQKKNPKLWQRGVALMKGTSWWNEVLNDENYGKKWQKDGITGEKLENLIASEVHARLVGVGGSNLLEEIAKEEGKADIISKLKRWILEFWKELKATLSNWSNEELDKLTLKDFNHMVVRDLASGVTVNYNQQQAQEELNNSTENMPKIGVNKVAVDKENPMVKLSSAFTPIQRIDRVNLIAKWFSDEVDSAVERLLISKEDELNAAIANKDIALEKEVRAAIDLLNDPVKGRQFAI